MELSLQQEVECKASYSKTVDHEQNNNCLKESLEVDPKESTNLQSSNISEIQCKIQNRIYEFEGREESVSTISDGNQMDILLEQSNASIEEAQSKEVPADSVCFEESLAIGTLYIKDENISDCEDAIQGGNKSTNATESTHDNGAETDTSNIIADSHVASNQEIPFPANVLNQQRSSSTTYDGPPDVVECHDQAQSTSLDSVQSDSTSIPSKSCVVKHSKINSKILSGKVDYLVNSESRNSNIEVDGGNMSTSLMPTWHSISVDGSAPGQDTHNNNESKTEREIPVTVNNPRDMIKPMKPPAKKAARLSSLQDSNNNNDGVNRENEQAYTLGALSAVDISVKNSRVGIYAKGADIDISRKGAQIDISVKEAGFSISVTDARVESSEASGGETASRRPHRGKEVTVKDQVSRGLSHEPVASSLAIGQYISKEISDVTTSMRPLLEEEANDQVSSGLSHESVASPMAIRKEISKETSDVTTFMTKRREENATVVGDHVAAGPSYGHVALPSGREIPEETSQVTTPFGDFQLGKGDIIVVGGHVPMVGLTPLPRMDVSRPNKAASNDAVKFGEFESHGSRDTQEMPGFAGLRLAKHRKTEENNNEVPEPRTVVFKRRKNQGRARHDTVAVRGGGGGNASHILRGVVREVAQADEERKPVPSSAIEDRGGGGVDGRVFECSLCEDTFDTPQGLTMHRHYHQEATAFSCDVCGVGFDKEAKLQRHLRTHTGAAELRCPTCDVIFRDAASFRRHRDQHQGKLAFRGMQLCETCGVPLRTRAQVLYHRRKHAGLRPFACATCGKDFPEKRTLIRHVRCHTDERPFKCETCSSAFRDKNQLKKHVRIHTGAKPYHCELCNKSFRQQSGLLVHGRRFHTLERPFGCSHCAKTFLTKGAMATHERTHTGEKPFQCPLCDYRCADQSSMSKHARGHTGERRYRCDVCAATFTSNSSLSYHAKTHGASREKSHKCGLCEAAFYQSSHLKTHLARHEGVKSHKCDVCGGFFASRQSLECHVRTHTGEKPFSCRICDATFRGANNLRVHLRTHTGDKPYACAACGRRFASASSLRYHGRVHRGEKPFPCDLCDLAFRQKGHMVRHKQRCHEGCKTHECPVCHASFFDSRSLKKHGNVHLKDGAHRCGVCGATFTDTSFLVIHLRRHSGEKPFSCPHCPKRFVCKSDLNVHLRSHTKDKPYKCDVCGLGCTNKTNLTRHIATHSGKWNFKCDTCGVVFARSRLLIQHVALIHDLKAPDENARADTVSA